MINPALLQIAPSTNMSHRDWLAIWSAVVAFFGGGTLQKLSVYVSKNLPPLPANAGWWKQFFYNLLKNVSGLDPNATIVPAKAPIPENK